MLSLYRRASCHYLASESSPCTHLLLPLAPERHFFVSDAQSRKNRLTQWLSTGGIHTPGGTWEGPKGYVPVGGDRALPCTILQCYTGATHPARCGGWGKFACSSCCCSTFKHMPPSSPLCPPSPAFRPATHLSPCPSSQSASRRRRYTDP